MSAQPLAAAGRPPRTSVLLRRFHRRRPQSRRSFPQALLGAGQRVTRVRGRFLPSDLAPFVIATVHPSSLLRAYDDTRAAEIERFVADLRVAASGQ